MLFKEMHDQPGGLLRHSVLQEAAVWVGAVAFKKYVDELDKRPADKMNEFAQTALTATQKGLPAINTWTPRSPSPS